MKDLPPWGKFYWMDFLNDPKVVAMSLEEKGAYIVLLCRAWFEDPTGTLPGSDEEIANLVGASAEQWERIGPRVMRPFVWDEGLDRFVQPRMYQEARASISALEAAREAGKKGAQKRWNRKPNRVPNGKANGKTMANQNQSKSQKDPPTGDRKPRKRDLIWEVVIELWYPDGIIEDDRKRLNAVVKKFRDRNATPEEIRERRKRFKTDPRWSNIPCTPEALAKHWGEFAGVDHPDGRVPAPGSKYAGLGRSDDPGGLF